MSTLSVSLGELHAPDGGTFVYQDQVCAYRPYQAPDGGSEVTRIAQEGPCEAWEIVFKPGGGNSYELIAANTGAITLQRSSGTLSFAYNGMHPCQQSNLASRNTPLFSPGETMTIASAGGLDFPAFNVKLRAPERLLHEVPSVRRGQPVTLRWTPGTATSFSLQLTTSTNARSRYISCRVPDAAGTYTVSGALTALLEAAPTSRYLRVERGNHVHLEPPERNVAIELQAAASSSGVDFPYTP